MPGSTRTRSSNGTIYGDHIRISLRLDPEVQEYDYRAEEYEYRAEEYGGDDPREPSPKPKEGGSPIAVPLPRKSLTADPYKVTWDGPTDRTNPQNWSRARKWAITLLCTLTTVNVTFASSAPSAAAEAITRHFGVGTELGYLVTSIFLCGYVVGPLLWGPGSELFGRRIIFRICLTAYVILHLGQALATNIQTLIITRFLSGVFACAPLTVCGGVIVDMWDPLTRGTATVIFVGGIFLGPVLGPIAGGFLTMSFLGWRWVFWIMMIFAGACTVLAFLFLPETYAPVLLQWKAKRLRKADPQGNAQVYAEHERSDWSLRGLAHRTVQRPIIMLIQEPILLLVTVYVSLVYGLLYALFEALPLIFVGNHHFNIGESGLVFIGVGLGTTLGACTTLYLSRNYPTLIVQWRGFPPPEERLWGAMIGGPLLVVGCFWLGWTGQYPSVHWIVPALATIPIGASVTLIFNSFLTYLIDTYLQYSASAFSANTIVRSSMGAAFPLFTVQMMNNLGINWACSLLGFVCLVLASSPFLFFKYGTRIRASSKFAPSLDLAIAKEIAAEKLAAGQSEEKVHEIV